MRLFLRQLMQALYFNRLGADQSKVKKLANYLKYYII